MLEDGTIKNAQQMRFAEKCKQIVLTSGTRKPPHVEWWWGASGVGKTHKAFELYPNAWVSNESLQWWEGYEGQREIILDDFRGDFCKFHQLIRYIDKYPIKVPVKGGSVQLMAETIIITSCYTPEQCYENKTDEDMIQLIRRITGGVKKINRET